MKLFDIKGYTGPEGRRRLLGSILVLFLLASISGTLFGYLVTIDFPQVSKLEDYRPPVGTKIFSDVGELLYEFGGQKRVLVKSAMIPDILRQAIIATEDSRFHDHFGIDPRSIARAVLKDLIAMRFAQGASTITQQLARALFLKPDKTLWRKVQEAVLALQIEKAYTKEEILEFYLNQIYMGHGRYGVEAASRYYFGKRAAELNLAEASLLAGILQRPEALSPFRHPERALAKRKHVLNRMVKEGYLTHSQAEAIGEEPLVLGEHQEERNPAPHFVEMIRRYLVEEYGEEALYAEGMEVYTSLNLGMQEAANQAVKKGLLALDHRQGFRGPRKNVLEVKGTTLEEYWDDAWDGEIVPGKSFPGLVLATGPEGYPVRVGSYAGLLSADGAGWIPKNRFGEILKPGDLTRVRIEAVTPETDTVKLYLDQEPEVEGALVALDPATGEIKAMVGGYDFRRSQFNRAIQSKRQSGSAFKPIVYAAALEDGYRLTDTFLDHPTLFQDEGGIESYQPENYLRRYFGLTTFREALEESRNIVSVKLFSQIGFQRGVEMARRMGIQSSLRALPSLVLGSLEVTLQELTSAYGVFPNQGIHVEPHFIRYVVGGEGRIREEADPIVREVLRADIAYVMTHLLEGVVESGTGKNARILGIPMGGKTGTTDDLTDAWFIGFTPELVCGVWVGFDKKKTLGKNETGARAALPIWIDFFRKSLGPESPDHFHRPPNVVLVPIDRETGLRASLDTGCSDIILESFLKGTEPATYCSAQEHFRRTLPYFLQMFPVEKKNSIRISMEELLALLAEFPHDLYLVDSGRFLALQRKGEEDLLIPLDLTRKERQAVLARLATGSLEDSEPVGAFWDWADAGLPVGLDGRPVRVIKIDFGS